MAFTRCRTCHHYDDQHAPNPNVMNERICLSFSQENGAYCPCNGFVPMGGSPEGTDIYREDDPPRQAGYHLREIERGELGEVSKIREEFEEFIDAIDQRATIMQFCELADLVGAIRAWLARHHPSVSLDDVMRMTNLTERAFRSGRRR